MSTVSFIEEIATFRQQDFLRCRGYFPTKEKLIEAIYALKTHPNCRIIRIENRIKTLGDVIIIYWHGQNNIAEAQFVLQTF